MSTVDGLPAHILLVHFIVVLAPLTAILAIVCSLWPAARRRLVWLVAVLAVVTLVMTPITTDAGEWLEKRVERSAAVHKHTELGDTMLYYSIALVVAAAALVFLHLRERRQAGAPTLLKAGVAVVSIVAGIASIVGVYLIGDSGATATWGDQDYSVVGPSGEDG
ncbi:hypothetical protein GCM10007304_15120 [Rhodococcoides trifolii]|uniref:DUF2231 domain-containing protein n=1 Tax=Rhodococcoides trifolii TaxID=908250 RepID=A0A917CYV9_9NOCA|nr:DUF2231 domain-containing protein [Rhodococcus trifolii]GGG02114.1 hypothetical protein GCM10007304_15120 [Rhodococcus trifolii]